MENSQSKCVSLLDAINDKYGDYEMANCEIFISFRAPGGTSDSGKLIVPQHLNVHDSKVASAGPREELSALCGDVQELDLTNNNIQDWKEVFTMLECMKNLNSLNLTSNELDSSTLTEDLTTVFSNLALLVVNNTGITWETVSKLLKLFPCLTELHLSLNQLGSMASCDINNYQSLKVLHLNHHTYSHLSELIEIGNCFPCLESLVTTEINLQTLQSEKLASAFPKLTCLNISKSCLEGWLDVDACRELPSLCDLRIQNVPFLDNYEEKVRRGLLIAHLPNVTRLNGSSISDTEREDAERAHIRHYMDMDNCMRPYRYDELIQKYGKLDPLADVNMEPKVTCKVKVAVEGTDKVEEIEICLKQSVNDFKKFLRPFSGINSKFNLILYDFINGKRTIKDDLTYYKEKMLYNCKVDDGDLFLIIPPLSEGKRMPLKKFPFNPLFANSQNKNTK